MKIVLSRSTNPNNPIDKNCLKKTAWIDDNAAEEIILYIYKDDGEYICNIEGYLNPDKAGILVTRFHFYGIKSMDEKVELLRQVVNFIFDINRMGQRVLEIHIDIDSSNVDLTTIKLLGFCSFRFCTCL